ncbi:MAG TPA: ATP-binding cassette domain-containing protein [Deinococcales bacterium]|nr:ATP-binding cassette domain-containing protein [Deinococcales bacterium]
MEPLLELHGITKHFGPVEALSGADFSILPGEVVGLVGDNGAGKSTLMKVINGVYPPDAGSMKMRGQPVRFHSPVDASDRGIEMVFQDFALVDNLDVKANIFLGREPVRRYLGGLVNTVDRRAMAQKTEQILRGTLNLEIPSVHEKVAALSGGQRQGVAIGRALLFQPSLLILDEPTASLSVDKIDKVLKLIARLKEIGVAVILITHRLQEIFTVSDRIVVMYRGRAVANLRTADTNLAAVVGHMIGGELLVV